MAVGILWYAQQAKVWFDAAIADADLTSVTETIGEMLSGSEKEYTGRCKDVRITGGSRDLTAVDTLGINQLEQPGRPDMVTAEFTLIYGDSDTAKYIAGEPNLTNITSTEFTGTFTRYQYGEKSTIVADRAKSAVLFQLDNGADTSSSDLKLVNCLLNLADCTNRESSLNADGHVEERLTFKCLAQNYYEEDNFSV